MYNKCSDNVVTNNNNDTRVFDISRNMLNIVFSKIKQINETTSNLRGRINYVIKYRLISFPFCLEKTYGAILKNNFKIKENLNISLIEAFLLEFYLTKFYVIFENINFSVYSTRKH